MTDQIPTVFSSSHGGFDDLFIVYDATANTGNVNNIGTSDSFNVDEVNKDTGELIKMAVAPFPASAGGLVMRDSSGNGKDGFGSDFGGFQTWRVPGIVPGNTAFESFGGFAHFSADLDFSSGFVWEGWIRGSAWSLRITAPGIFMDVYQDSGTVASPLDRVSSNISTGLSTPNGTWLNGATPNSLTTHYLVVRIIGTTAQIYIDAVLQASAALSSYPLAGVTSLTDFVFEYLNNNILDEVAIYNNLSPAEITAHYTAGLSDFSSYNAAVLADSPLAYYHMDDAGPSGEPWLGTTRFWGGKMVISAAYLLNGSTFGISHLPNSAGWFVYDDATLTNPTFYPFTDATNSDWLNENENDDYALHYDTDGQYGYFRKNDALKHLRKYALTGGAALPQTAINTQNGAPITDIDMNFPTLYKEPSPLYFETWCFHPDGKHVYMGMTGEADIAGTSNNVWYGAVGRGIPGSTYFGSGGEGAFTNFPLWLDFSYLYEDRTSSGGRVSISSIDEICVDHSTGHVFLMWDSFETNVAIFIDEYTADAEFVHTWIPRTSHAPNPSYTDLILPGGQVNDFGPDWGSAPYNWDQKYAPQGATFWGAMTAADGILWVNMDLYWGSGFAEPTGHELEDAVWRIDTRTGEGENEYFCRANRSAAEQAITYTITPIQSLAVGSRNRGTSMATAKSTEIKPIPKISALRLNPVSSNSSPVVPGGGGSTGSTLTPRAPHITPRSFPQGDINVGLNFSWFFFATGDLIDGPIDTNAGPNHNTGANMTWTIVGGAIPPGCSLSSSGRLTGPATSAGTYHFTLKATNNAGSDTQAFTLMIQP